MKPRVSSGFSLLELLVALAVFAALAAAAYGGLASIARTRAALAQQQDRFAAVTRAVSALERDLRQAIARPVLDNSGHPTNALLGNSSSIELTRLGYANPLAEPRSHLERVVYASDRGTLRRARYAVLDRAPDSAPQVRELLERAGELHLRYYGCDQVWHEAWPPRGLACASAAPVDPLAVLPRAIEFRFTPEGLGELRRVVELPSTLPLQAPP
ncbi:type II secretion system minor pseudopilin GspJ [Dokdonella sp.]|uniref:type II secretion system minor pseudopilin GspJ n=1 Tax=Dokdonella sp. TaxID=2291710 RepID=UPI003782F0EC